MIIFFSQKNSNDFSAKRLDDSKMKIVHVDINGWVYGVQKYVINLCREMKKIDGYQSVVVGACAEYFNRLREENIDVIPLVENWRKIEFDPKICVRLYQVIKKEKPDIIHSHSTKENIACKIIGGLLKIPVIPIYHCNHKLYERKDSRVEIKRKIYETIYLDILERWTSHFSPRNIAVSHSVKDNIKRFGIPGEKIEVIYSGINENDFRSRKFNHRNAKTKVKILSISRIDENKGIFDIINAAKIIKEKGCSFEINFGGDGPLLRESKELAARSRLNEEVKFLGYVKNVQKIQEASDILVSASYSEGLPLNIIEAMAMGLTVVATNIGGVSEIIEHGKNGLMTPCKNPIVLAENLFTVIQDARLRLRYGQEARETILQKFGIRKMVNNILNLYHFLPLKREGIS